VNEEDVAHWGAVAPKEKKAMNGMDTSPILETDNYTYFSTHRSAPCTEILFIYGAS